jgi:mono/diheme cytochrome c family protein
MQRQMRTLVLAAAISLSVSLKAEFKASAEEGKKLYEANNCGSCHAMDKKVVGPALRGVNDRRSEEWLIKWIRNNEALRKSGDADANALYKEYGGAAMNIFENLSPDQVKHILEYIKTAPKPVVPKTTTAAAGEESGKSDSNTLFILLALIGIFVIVLVILGKVRNTLRRLASEQDGTFEETSKGSFIKGLLPEKLAKMNPTVLTVFTVVILGGIGFVWSYKFGITEVGVQKGYAPTQPIAYSHKLHAGDLKIDCKYCHVGVEESKSATIPSLNICMNCHKGVQKASTAEGDEISPQIAKIYKALDYDPEKIGAEAFGPNPKPIRWVRIHNLPDHAYFNHSQHVKVAGLACQTCHGPIEKMEVVQQWSSLQMGWCIDCHRNAGIDAANNNYYAALHEKAAKDLKDNKNKSQYFGPDGKVKITPAMNGGLECAKCHY